MKVRIFIVTMLFVCNMGVFATGNLSNAEAMFIYNFLRHVEWPANGNSSEFIIGVYGNTETFEQLVQFTRNRRVGTKTIAVRKISSVAEVTGCQLVFVAHNQISKTAEIKSAIGNKACLLVGEKEGSNALGSAIEFVIQENRLKFRVDESNAKQQNLMVSRALLDMSIQ